MRILGIDPGTTRIGFGVIEYSKNKLTCISYGIIENPGKDALEDFKSTFTAVHQLVDQYAPQRASIEKLFFMNNQKTAMAVAEMRGVIRYALSQKGLRPFEYTPLQVKQAVCNYGKADKKQVHDMVRMILKIPQKISPDDAADALAIALCCATVE